MADLPEFKYTARFTAQAHLYVPSSEEQYEAKASLGRLKSLLPADIVPENDIDIVYIVGNLAVAGLMNLNDDAVTIEDTLKFYKSFERRQCNFRNHKLNYSV